jgi:EAL domain-containing protein (putative c-di-GMP-specific phosphodiesterase class I)/GGDEF domain-containing protein
VAGVAAYNAWRAARRARQLEANVWRLFLVGLACWSLGCLPYLAFLATGGNPTSPSAWSQAGFLAAYPFWYGALLLVRQPILAVGRWSRIEARLIEVLVFAMLATVVLAGLWNYDLSASGNVSQLVPAALDLLLLAGLYNAVRRSSGSWQSAFSWLTVGFAALAITDGLVTLLVTRISSDAAAFATVGYCVAMGLVAMGTLYPIRITETRARLGPSTALLAAIGLALAGPAAVLAPEPVRPAIWAVAAVLFWRLLMLLRAGRESETDPLTGLLEDRPFARHLAGVSQASIQSRPAALIAVDVAGFGRWNAEHGYRAGDELLTEIAGQLEHARLPEGVWSRIGADRFGWVGACPDLASGRRLAEDARAAAAANSASIGARAALVMLPDDAETAANALAALDEALQAARAAQRRVVAFDRGNLDGIEYAGGYTASLAHRREAIIQILRADESIITVFQPIISLQDGQTVGFEALSRFRALSGRSPERTPDRWIAEAHAVGLGLEVEVECVRRACRARIGLAGRAYLSVNMSPAAALSPEMDDALGRGRLDGLVIEITEHDAVGDYAQLAARLDHFRSRGAFLAIDDTGAGHASMRHVARLSPDYIKVDRSLIHDVHADHAKRALVRSIVSLEKELGTTVVAEGIESRLELEVLRELGVPLGQGYLLGRPGALLPDTLTG